MTMCFRFNIKLMAESKLNIPDQSEIETLPKDGGNDWNRLVFEQSPYLLQHAANPVDWYPWSDEAFARAAKEDKAVFLSIGYSTCHWCHVMAHESFEDKEVGELLNKNFICIKVDREERPDIDHVYMTVTQAITGHGGWPMTVILTPEKKPFFAATYIPKHSFHNRSGMLDLIPAIAKAWKEDRERILTSAENITSAIQDMTTSRKNKNKILEFYDASQMTISDYKIHERIFDDAYNSLEAQFDQNNGGFGYAPKFPSSHLYSLLLRYAYRLSLSSGKQANEESNDKELNEKIQFAENIVEKTLTQMRLGGIFDHIGFGFHRYSTDENWLVPHFEKMLYDQAMLIITYTDAYLYFKNDFYKKTVEEIIAYLLRDMVSPEGGFYSAEDADSEGVEGKCYLWTSDEIKKILEPKDAELFIKIFNFRDDGNFLEEATRKKTGENIIHLKTTLNMALREDIQSPDGNTENDLENKIDKLEEIREKLFTIREKRIHPYKDDKILTDWNGLMIAALSKASRVFEHDTEADGDEIAVNQFINNAGIKPYLEAAKKAADFIIKNLVDKDGKLLKRYRNGKAGLNAHLSDYASMTWGLLELYQTSNEIQYLEKATELADLMLKHFWDEKEGGFFLTADYSEKLFVKSKETYDGAIPSGNSIAAYSLAKLFKITNNDKYASKAKETINAFGDQINSSPTAYGFMLIALDLLTEKYICNEFSCQQALFN